MIDVIWYLTKWIIGILFCWSILKFIFSPRRTFAYIHSSWYHPFENLQFSAIEFYASVEEKVKAKNIKGVTIHTVEYGQDRFSFAKRKYLQICYEDQLLLLGAAPFGPDSFVSWRVGEPYSSFDAFMIQLPYIGKVLERSLNSRTFYQVDTNNIFRDMVHDCVTRTIAEHKAETGTRVPPELLRPIESDMQPAL